jgi:hypothetical protein
VLNYLHANWLTIVLGAWTFFNFVMNGIAQSLDAPTAQDTAEYRFWFKFVNYCALNSSRAKNNAAIEQSPNFIPAAEAYMQKKLAESGKGN